MSDINPNETALFWAKKLAGGDAAGAGDLRASCTGCFLLLPGPGYGKAASLEIELKYCGG